VLADNPFSLPPVVPIAREALEERQGRYALGQDALEFHAGPGYLYAAGNRLDVPTDVMFFPQDGRSFTAFDPASTAVTRLEFSRERSVAIEFSDGRRLSLERREDDPR
jgi:hypothetical protein